MSKTIQLANIGPVYVANMTDALTDEITNETTVQDAIKGLIGFKGHYADEAALVAAYPTATAGSWALLESTDTTWVWDSGDGAWEDTGSKFTGVDTIRFNIDGNGFAITTGIKGDLSIPFDCSITSYDILADQSGSIVVDLWVDTYANYPPTDADSITASAPVSISSATKGQDSTLTGWTKALTRGRSLRVNVDSCTSITRAQVTLYVGRT
uniref:Putative structural protein n=1 Tax=viral metagenome TaxID=1070528 RepID=A0A6M3M752_9ZZZZ